MAARAIETEYAGYRFRSRLEARWAVFFDTMGIAYEYEPEGFEFDWVLEYERREPFRYLPDFFLPAEGKWAEVKARWTPMERWRVYNAAACLGRDFGQDLLLLSDTFRSYRLPGSSSAVAMEDPSALHWAGSWLSWVGWNEPASPRIAVAQQGGSSPCGCSQHAGCTECEFGWPTNEELLREFDPLKGAGPMVPSSKWKAAAKAAQQARFEFGETPEVTR